MKQFEGYEEYLKQSELSKQTRQVYLREAEKICPVFKWKGNYKRSDDALQRKITGGGPFSCDDQSLCYSGKSIFKIFRMRAGIYKDIKSAEKRSVENVISRKEYQELLNYAKRSGREKILLYYEDIGTYRNTCQ